MIWHFNKILAAMRENAAQETFTYYAGVHKIVKHALQIFYVLKVLNLII